MNVRINNLKLSIYCEVKYDVDISSVPRADMAALAEAVTYVAHLDSVRGDVECVLGGAVALPAISQ